MKKSSSLIALAGALALLGGQAMAETKQPTAAKTVKTAVKKAQEGACGEGKCGAATGKKSAGKAGEGKCGEGKCGASVKKKPAKAAEGKCGEGKCGSK
ncbi:hypothetical protein [Neisseria dentiae]|uniref:HvfA family oxazolone/thioamide-modified RiPP metallophore n=1 Tax=Neisseria dentiae TaxID=194197 RepID=UPI0035A099C9